MVNLEPLRTFLAKIIFWFERTGAVAQFCLLLFFRLNWGWLYFGTGKGKLTGHEQVVTFFTSLHIPMPDITAWFVGGVECTGGILLLLGLATRPTGLILAINMVVAYLSVDDDRNTILNYMKDQDPFFKADPFFFLLAALLAFSFGGGPFSLDALIGKFLIDSKKTAAPESQMTLTPTI